MGNSGSSSRPFKILVVGDWLVDEHWVTGIHRSPTSSRTGRTHYRALHKLGGATQSFCGAGRTASVLAIAEKGEEQEKLFEVHGIGLWHPHDTDILTLMLNPVNILGRNPHRLSEKDKKTEKPSSARLFNLAKPSADDSEPSFGTTRIIRIYQQTGDSIELLERFDWEVGEEVEEPDHPTSEVSPDWSTLDAFIDGVGKEDTGPDAVIIKDLCKGVVSPALIAHLTEKIPAGTPWYISSKDWRPAWMESLTDEVRIRLLMIPQVAARLAARRSDVPLSFWMTKTGMTKTGKPSRAALKQLDEFVEWLPHDETEPPLILVLPGEGYVLTREQLDGQIEGRIFPIKPGPPTRIPLPMASVFFGGLVAHLLVEGGPSWGRVQHALAFTKRWQKYEAQRVVDVDNWTPDREEPPLPSHDTANGEDERKPFVWNDEKDHWDRAFQELGVVEVRDKNAEAEGQESTTRKKIELWRAMTEVDGYICCVKQKRQILQALLKEIRIFVDRREPQSQSCLLVAPPGSGKTHLVRCLSKMLGLRFLGFNIAQLISKMDILDSFDTIVTTQAQSPGEKVLVFFDEINAHILGQRVYDTFLAPLEEDTYVRAGKAFRLEPCMWIFAGTERPSDDDDAPKASDFESRLSVAPLRMRIDTPTTGQKEELRTEKVYLGTSLLRTIYPDVRFVSEKVLQVFHRLREDLEVRELRHFIEAFSNIQYARVVSQNVAVEWLENFQRPNDTRGSGVDVQDWQRNSLEGKMVEIVGPPV